MFSDEVCKISKNNFSDRTPQVAASLDMREKCCVCLCQINYSSEKSTKYQCNISQKMKQKKKMIKAIPTEQDLMLIVILSKDTAVCVLHWPSF